MKDFIEKSGLTASQFAKKYDIPYNTVRQWTEGIRSAPTWLKKLFEYEAAYKPLCEEKIYIAYTFSHGIEINPRIYKSEKELEEWKKLAKKWKIKTVIKEYEFITKKLIEYDKGEKNERP